MRCLEDTRSHCQEGTALSCPPSPCLSSPADQYAGMDKHSSQCPAAAQPSALIPSPEDPVRWRTSSHAFLPPQEPSPRPSSVLPTGVGSRAHSLQSNRAKGRQGNGTVVPRSMSRALLWTRTACPSPLLAVHGQHHAGVLQLHLHPPGDELQHVPAQHRQGLRGLPWAWRTERVTGRTGPNPHTPEQEGAIPQPNPSGSSAAMGATSPQQQSLFLFLS